ncbi:zinc metalloprotease [Paraliomyxa miuraensis]|uniref:hypothetical protein n=1 Tax=Paraliomyxa miuraensis TaxID=376150 RepID=UPI0022598F14|nr:hypothetical protein [Paraliomyxa miuraensis]MCX4239293.1 hypothetical protein [Paraliomyxa miuraensis]
MKRLWLGSCLCVGIACGSGVDVGGSGGSRGSGSAEDSGETGGTTSDGSGTAGATEVDTTAGSADTTGDPEPLPPPPATGIEIVEITVDQGVRVPVFRDGALVGPAERNAAVLQGRELVLRAFFETDPGWQARPIYGLLTLEHDDGTTAVYEGFTEASEPQCAAFDHLYDCRYGDDNGSLLWRVEGVDVRPGTAYRIELLEAIPGHEDDVSDKSPVFPVDGGTEEIGIESSYMKMRVVVVPFYHDVGAACAQAPDLLEEFGTDYHGNPRTVAGLFRERLFANNPVDEVEIIVHDVVDYGGNAQQGGGLLQTLQQLRFAEGAPPEYYYYGVIRPCQGTPDFSGIAQLGGPSPGQAAQRVGWGVYHGNPSTTADTFVHEIGHEQGRFHIACSGDEGGPDPSYPDHPDGNTLSWGIDVMSKPTIIKPPSSHEYMSYCGPTWVSEWGWHLVSPWIEEISSWERSGGVGPTRPLLVGTVRADGSSSFYVAQGWFHEGLVRSGHVVRVTAVDGRVLEVPAQWQPWERSDDANVIAPLPVALEEIEALRWVTPRRSGVIDRATVREVESLAGPSTTVGPARYSPAVP